MDLSEFERIASSINSIKSRNDKLMSDHGSLKDVVDDVLTRLKKLELAFEAALAPKAEEPPAQPTPTPATPAPSEGTPTV